MGEKASVPRKGEFKVLIEKELCNPVSVNGCIEIRGPFYHIYTVGEDGEKTLVETVDGDVREAARTAERKLDLHAIEIAYKGDMNCFLSTIDPVRAEGSPEPEALVPLKDVKEMVGQYVAKGVRCMEDSENSGEQGTCSFWGGFINCAESIMRELES